MIRLSHLLSSSWRTATLGVLASLPATVLLNWLPNSEANVAGGVMIVGAAIAGALADGPDESAAAGARAGFIGGVIAVLVLAIEAGPTVLGPTTQVPFLIFSVAAVLCVSPLFGWVFGRLGGWIRERIAG